MAVNKFTNGAGGNTWNTAGNWSQGSIPTSSDGHVTTFDATSPNCTLGGARSCNNIDFTGYTNTLTMSTNNLTVAGNVTLDTGLVISGTGTMIVSASSTITSNGKTWPNAMTWNGSTQTITLVGDLTISGLLTTSGAPSKTVNQTTAEVLYLAGGCTATTYAVTGTAELEMTGGTFTGTFNNTTRINGNVTFGTVVWGNTGESLTHVSGTVTISTSLTIYAVGGVDLDLGSVTLSSMTIGFFSGTQTVNLLSTLNVTTLTIATFNTTFTGSFGFSCTNLSIPAVSAITITLKDGTTYAVTGQIYAYLSRVASNVLITSSHGTNKAILTVNYGASIRLNCSFTRIDASGGRPLRTFNGTVTDCEYINSFYDLKTMAA